MIGKKLQYSIKISFIKMRKRWFGSQSKNVEEV